MLAATCSYNVASVYGYFSPAGLAQTPPMSNRSASDVASCSTTESSLRPSLTTLRGTAVMLNIVLGAGLLTLPGLAVLQLGNQAILVWLFCALAALPLLIAFTLLASRIPHAGGMAKVASLSLGDFGLVLTTLLFLGAVLFGLPSIALTGGFYLQALIGGSAYLYAALLLLLAVGVNLLSVDWTSRINAAIASLVLMALVGVAGLGLALSAADIPSSLPSWPPSLSLANFGLTFMMVFFAFTGWEVAANLSAEFHRPQRDFPRAMALSFLVALLIYFALALVAGAMDVTARPEAPFALLFEQRFGTAGLLCISLLAVVMISANLAAAVWAVSRMVWAASKEGILPPLLSRVSGAVPAAAVIVTVAAFLAVTALSALGWVNLASMLALAGQNFLLIYGLAILTLILKGRNGLEKGLGVFCVIQVILLVAWRGSDGLIYPLLLALAATLVTLRRQQKAIRGLAE